MTATGRFILYWIVEYLDKKTNTWMPYDVFICRKEARAFLRRKRASLPVKRWRLAKFNRGVQ